MANDEPRQVAPMGNNTYALNAIAERLQCVRSTVTTACEALENDDSEPRDEHIARTLRMACERIDHEIDVLAVMVMRTAPPPVLRAVARKASKG